MTFGEKIVMLRKQFKWSQDELARKIGTSSGVTSATRSNLLLTWLPR